MSAHRQQRFREDEWPHQWIGMCSCRRGIRCNDEATMAAFMDECAADHTEGNDKR